MDFTGRYLISAPPESVWAGLNDPAILAAAIPGCEALTKTDENAFSGAVTVKIGPMKISFKGKVGLSDLEPPHRLKLSGSGDAGVSGFAKGGADIVLEPKDGGTELSYAARADIGGKLAQIGQRLIDGAARQLADQFFERFSAAVTPRLEPDPASAQLGTVVMAPAAATPEPQSHAQQSRIWLLGLAGVILVMAALLRLSFEAQARTLPAMTKVSFSVNGKPVSAEVEDRTLLVYFLREQLALTGTHIGCDTSQCGACMVHVDGRAVKSCTLFAVADGAAVTTIEGLARDGALHPVQEAFREHHGLQCGFCTPGMIMTALDMIGRGAATSRAAIRHELEGNICRCTGYHNIVSAIEAAARQMGAKAEAAE